jgi:serine protease inhibitor
MSSELYFVGFLMLDSLKFCKNNLALYLYIKNENNIANGAKNMNIGIITKLISAVSTTA